MVGLAVLGGFIWATPLELGTFGLVLAVATPVAIVALQSNISSRLQGVGAYLIGGGIAGVAILLSVILSIRNLCGTPGGHVQTPSGTSYECYSAETLWFLLPYAALACLGALMLFLARNRRPPASSILPRG